MLRKTWLHVVLLLVVFGVGFVWMPWLDDKGGKDGVASVGAMAAVSQVGPDPVEASQDVFVCPCGGPGWCVGPRGGVYCIDMNGKKKYRPKN